MNQKWPILILWLLVLYVAALAEAQSQKSPADHLAVVSWENLATGLELGVLQSPQKAEIGDSLIRVLRIDPQYYRFRLLSASAIEKGQPLTTKQWSLKYGLAAAINASMYQKDFKTSVSLMRTQGHINNPKLSKDMTILACGRKGSDIPHVKIIDRECDDFQIWKNQYRTQVQSIRMISCTGNNVWQPQSKKYSTAVIGTDHQNRVLFIHVQSPYSTHDLINILQSLPLDIDRAMYTEGGAEAQLFVMTASGEHEFVGFYESYFKDAPSFSLPIPNIIGIVPRDKPNP